MGLSKLVAFHFVFTMKTRPKYWGHSQCLSVRTGAAAIVTGPNPAGTGQWRADFMMMGDDG